MPQNIPDFPPITKIQFNKSISLFQQAKQFVLDQELDIDEHNLIFFSKQKQRVIYENDTIDSIYDENDKPEIELYLFKNILNQSLSYQNQITFNQQFKNDFNINSTKKELDALQKEFDNFKKESEQKIEILNKRCKTLIDENDTLNKERKEQRDKYDKLEKILRNQKQQQKEIIIPENQQQLNTNYNVEIYKMKLDLDTKNREIASLELNNETLKSQLEEKRKELTQNQLNQEKTEQKYSKLYIENENIKLKKDQLEQKNQSLLEDIQELQKSINLQKETQKQNEQLIKDQKIFQQKFDCQQIENQANIQMIQERNKIISELKEIKKNLDLEISNLKQEIKELQQLCNQMKKNSEVQKQQLEKQNNRFEFLKYFIENNPFKQLQDNIITPIDQMFQAKINPYEFTKSKNVNTNSCESQVCSLTIKNKENILQWLQFKSNVKFDTFLQKEPVKTWKILKSINKLGQGSKSKCFLMEVQSCTENDKTFEKSVFALKMIDGHDEIKKEKYILFLSFQIVIAQVLAENFQEQIKTLLPEFKFKFQIPHLFIIGENFYIGQRLQNKSYISFGQDVNQQEIKLMNAFSQFTYEFTQGALIVTNMKGGQKNGNEYIFYEPIIYTPEGVFGPEDYGQTAFDSTLLSLNNKVMAHLNGKEFLQNLKYDF